MVDPFWCGPLVWGIGQWTHIKKCPAILIWRIINLAGLLLPNFGYVFMTDLLTNLFTKLLSLS